MTKCCKVCGEEKSLDEFHLDRASRDGHVRRCRVCVKRHDDTTRDQRNERARQLYAADPETKIAKTRAYHLAHPEWSRERLRAHHVANDVVRAEKARQRGLDPAVQASRRDATRRSEQRRRAQKAGGCADYLTAADIAALLASYSGCCYCCGREFSADLPYSLDHWQPLARGGEHVLTNLRPACLPCNTRKNARWPFTDADIAEVRRAVLGAAAAAEQGAGVMP